MIAHISASTCAASWIVKRLASQFSPIEPGLAPTAFEEVRGKLREQSECRAEIVWPLSRDDLDVRRRIIADAGGTCSLTLVGHSDASFNVTAG